MSIFSRILSTPGRQYAALAGALTVMRIAAIIFGHPDLGPDEGQYWFWSKAPAFGYFSKPPMIAWSIAATTAVFGDAEWAVRLSAPLYQLGAATFLFFLCRRIAGPLEALIAGGAYITLPGVFLSSALITTDAPLLFFWCAALYFFFDLTNGEQPGGRIKSAVLLGAAIGFGFMSKYAMTYFVLGAALALLLSPARRRAAGAGNLIIAGLVALALFAPNIWWNAQNDFQTISHTAANANWSREFGHPGRLFDFLLAQLGVAGPIMLALIFLAALFGRRGVSAKDREAMMFLLAFSIPAMAIVTTQSFISRAHGNWAAVAYPSAVVMAAIFAFRDKRALLALKASILLHIVIGLGFLAAYSNSSFADGIGAGAGFRKLRGWEEQGAEIAKASLPYDAIMTDDREVTGELVYYARGGKPIVAWNSNNRIDSHFEAFTAFDPQRHHRVLYVSEQADALYIQKRFKTITPITALSARTGPGHVRVLYLFEVADFVRH